MTLGRVPLVAPEEDTITELFEGYGMHGSTPAMLQDVADQLNVLAGTLQSPARALKAQSIRKAEKALVGLEAFFTIELTQEARQWLKAGESLKVLEERLAQLEAMESEMTSLDERRGKLMEAMDSWARLSESERARIQHQARLIGSHTLEGLERTEGHILNRFQRYNALRALLPYADNAEYLCDAIFHYENRQKYEDNLQRLEEKKEQALERHRSVRRGFFLALGLCALIVTIPLCAPFAFSLWSRLKEIEQQIANMDETRRREKRRLQAADEGVVASQDIREVLGNVSLEHVRRTLAEVRELRGEFQRSEQNSSVTAGFLAFLDLYRGKLEMLFGTVPQEPSETFAWFTSRVNEMHNIENELGQLNTSREQLTSRSRELVKGYSAEILRSSIARLRAMRVGVFRLGSDLDVETKLLLAGVCQALPETLKHAREALGLVSHGYNVDESYWRRLHFELASLSNTLNACLVNLSLAGVWPESESEPESSAAALPARG